MTDWEKAAKAMENESASAQSTDAELARQAWQKEHGPMLRPDASRAAKMSIARQARLFAALTWALLVAAIACLLKPIGDLPVTFKLAVDGQYMDALQRIIPNLLLCAAGFLALFLSRSCYVTKNWLNAEREILRNGRCRVD
ncbi:MULTISPECIES: hypothetical protein [Bacteria]|jgi:hypothetical protein|uniref:hypothetical protein n=1 Tax=Bacteria TaxID=2 RepID=UPI00272CDA25|nr:MULTISPECIES: hypothetical protein [Bacteria]